MYFGKNIKKIRSIKKLSQAAFAEVFGLTRSSIGSYEEGRAEPKLEIIIKIAKYFRISVDNLVNSEMTVNELYNFHLADEYIDEDKRPEKGRLKKTETINIPLVPIKDFLLKSLAQVINESQNYIGLPGLNNKQIAILVEKDGFDYLPKEILVDDIIVVYSGFDMNDDLNLADKLYLIKSKKVMIVGEVKRIDKDKYLFVSQSSAPVEMHKSEIDYIFPVEKHISNSLTINNGELERIRKLELLINDLYNRI